MHRRAHPFSIFLRHFVRYAFYVRHVLVGLLALIVLGGVTISQLERIELGKAIYFAFITGLSIGYGDISPETAAGRVVSVLIGLVGMLFVGITVAIATRSLAIWYGTRRKAKNDVLRMKGSCGSILLFLIPANSSMGPAIHVRIPNPRRHRRVCFSV